MPRERERAALDRGSLDDALAILMREYGTAVYRYFRQRMADDDLAQEVQQMTFVQAHEGLARFARRCRCARGSSASPTTAVWTS